MTIRIASEDIEHMTFRELKNAEVIVHNNEPFLEADEDGFVLPARLRYWGIYTGAVPRSLLVTMIEGGLVMVGHGGDDDYARLRSYITRGYHIEFENFDG